MSRPRYLPAAQAHLADRDRVLAGLIERVGPCTLRRRPEPFSALVRIVISQQISTLAADAIEAKVDRRFARGGLTPRAVLRAPEADLRACGLSGAKVRTVRALAGRVLAGEIAVDRLSRMTDERIAAQLLPTPGIGPWSVHMYLMFGLGRPDVLPVGDYGLRVAVRNQFRLDELPGPDALTALAEPWRPYRTIASWYLWRSLNLPANGEVK
jgi:DNA-3-methyladenine glycosylase II